MPVFLGAAIIGFYQYYGFEACGDVAEEVAHPGKVIPKAMRRTIYVGGAAATLHLSDAAPGRRRLPGGDLRRGPRPGRQGPLRRPRRNPAHGW
ncbi:hypothetical protein LV779_08135 [Streptomyces thinghirensis]|nr:hypothetical protein [Streptomyces thinghirensis]